METWLGLLQEQRLTSSRLCNSKTSKQHDSSPRTAEQGGVADGSAAAAAAASTSSLVLDVHRMEGILFMLFCSCHESVRCDAYGLIGLLRTLHQQLGAVVQQSGAIPGSGAPAGSSAAAGSQATAVGVGGSSFASNTSAAEDKVASSSSNIQTSGGSGSGVELIRQHKPTISKDSLDFMLTLGGCGAVQRHSMAPAREWCLLVCS